MWWSTRSRGGFVLLEAVVALMIISLVAVALIGTTSAQIRTSAKATTMVTARSLAEDRLGALRLLDNQHLKSLPDSLEEGEFEAPFQEYRWTATATELKDELDLFEVKVAVTGRGESFSLTSLVYSPQPQTTARPNR